MSQAPTCSSCHMGPVAPVGNGPGLEMTHDVGARIAWTLRPKISIQPVGITAEDGSVVLKDPEGRRAEMTRVCQAGHDNGWIENSFIQFDSVVDLYTEFLPLAKELGEKAGKGEDVEAFIDATLHGEDGEAWEKYHRWTEGLNAEERQSMLEWEQKTYESRTE